MLGTGVKEKCLSIVSEIEDLHEKHGEGFQIVNMFWHGADLGPVHAACIRSFLHQGHPVILHCYSAPSDVPSGVQLFDASKLMPESDLIANSETGSVALGSNRYRYRLIEAGFGLYVDCDMYCLKPIPESDYIFGREDSQRINNAVLKYPANSILSKSLILATKKEYYVPEWFSTKRKTLLRIRRSFGIPRSVCDMPWGVWGPNLLTHKINEIGLEQKAKPIDYFYPVHYTNTSLLYESGLTLSDLVTSRTFAVHLCHKTLSSLQAPPDSPLGEIVKQV